MFSYLRTKNEFLKDCELKGYQSFKKKNYYEIKPCKVQKKDKCDSSYKNKYEPCLGCKNIPKITAWLVDSVSRSSWEDQNKDFYKRVDKSEVHAWCKSLCIYIRDVVKNIKKDNIVVGAEYFMEDSDNVLGTRARADVIIAGYNNKGDGVIFLIETKQYSYEWYKEKSKTDEKIIKDIEDAKNEVIAYYEDISKYKGENKLIPIVYLHNFEFTKLTDNLKNKIRKIEKECLIFYKDGRSLSDYINNELGENKDIKGNAIEIIKELKSKIKVFESSEMAKIMFCTADERYDNKEIFLRRDQGFAYKSIIDCINEGEKSISVVRGGAGSGKTLVASLLIRYAIKNEMKVLFAYSGAAPKNTYFTEELIRNELKPKKIEVENEDEINEYFDFISKVFSGTTTSPKLGLATKGTVPNELFFIKYKNKFEIDEYGKYEKYEKYHTAYKDKVGKSLKNWREYVDVRYYDSLDIYDEQYDIIIFDEFQRYGDNGKNIKDEGVRKRKNTNQIKKLINQSNNLVFLIDEKQNIDEKDDGARCIDKYIGKPEVNEYYLWSQFRCNLDEGYLSWVDKTFGLDDGKLRRAYVRGMQNPKDKIYLEDIDYTVKIISNIQELKKILKDKKYIIMGESNNIPKTEDIKKRMENKSGAPIIPFDEENCRLIYNSFRVQGLEFKDIVVIIDDRITYKDNKICLNDGCEDNLSIILNKYRVLLSRGLKSCSIYAVNEDLQKYLLSTLKRSNNS